MPTDTTILTDLADLADAWDDEPQPNELDAPAPLPRAWGVPAARKPPMDGHCGRWENGAPRFFGVGPRERTR